jgi:archaellum component FlaC
VSEKKQRTVCYGNLIEKIKELDLTIKQFKDTISNIKDSFNDVEEDLDFREEICIDELEADKAALNIIKDICLESLLEQEPEGDA